MKLDVRKYFDSISHHILSEQLQRLFKERRLIHIFCRLLDSYHVTPSHGLPIGNLTSQYFANHFLSVLDHEIIEKIKPQGFVRYMDDMVLWGSSPNELKVYYKKINEFIEQKLRLKLKAPVINRSTAGLTFLGRRIFTEGVIRWPGEKRRSFRKKVKQAILDHSLGGIGDRSLNMRLLTLFSQLESSKVQGFKINLYNELDHGYEAVTG